LVSGCADDRAARFPGNAPVRPRARKGFELLKQRGIRTTVISITWEFAVAHVARTLGADDWIGTVYHPAGPIGHVLPEDKPRYLARTEGPILPHFQVWDRGEDGAQAQVNLYPRQVGSRANRRGDRFPRDASSGRLEQPLNPEPLAEEVDPTIGGQPLLAHAKPVSALGKDV